MLGANGKPSSAWGYGQLTNGAAADVARAVPGFNKYDPNTAVFGSAEYLKILADRNHGDVHSALNAYGGTSDYAADIARRAGGGIDMPRPSADRTAMTIHPSIAPVSPIASTALTSDHARYDVLAETMKRDTVEQLFKGANTARDSQNASMATSIQTYGQSAAVRREAGGCEPSREIGRFADGEAARCGALSGDALQLAEGRAGAPADAIERPFELVLAGLVLCKRKGGRHANARDRATGEPRRDRDGLEGRDGFFDLGGARAKDFEKSAAFHRKSARHGPAARHDVDHGSADVLQLHQLGGVEADRGAMGLMGLGAGAKNSSVRSGRGRGLVGSGGKARLGIGRRRDAGRARGGSGRTGAGQHRRIDLPECRGGPGLPFFYRGRGRLGCLGHLLERGVGRRESRGVGAETKGGEVGRACCDAHGKASPSMIGGTSRQPWTRSAAASVSGHAITPLASGDSDAPDMSMTVLWPSGTMKRTKRPRPGGVKA